MCPVLNLQIVPMSDLPSRHADKERPVVLVVDDERVIADTLSIILTRSGYSALTAYDGESALELARVVPPQLLLSDVMMGPGMDGTQLAVELVGAFPECKILLFSGHAGTRDLLAKARDAGYSFTLLTKPLHPADLLVSVSESLSGGAPATA